MTPIQFNTHRKALGATQSALAATLGTTQRQLTRYETGAQKIPGTVEVLMHILSTRKIPKIKNPRRGRPAKTNLKGLHNAKT